MNNLIVYGSLMHPEELKKMSIDPSCASPVRALGYRRDFAQEPTRRQGIGKRRAVLTVVPSEADSFNGILLRQISPEQFTALDLRESGYSRLSVNTEAIKGFQGERLPLVQTDLYVGEKQQRNDQLLPNPSYLTLCLEGARFWDEEFYNEFLHKTRVGNLTLREFLVDKIE